MLSGEDEACAAYVERFGSEAALAAEKQRAAAVSSAPTAKAAAAVTNLDDAIIRGLKADAARLAKEALATENELSLVEKHLIPALDKVGTDYERGVAFLPQLLGAAQAAQAVFSVIRDSLAAKGGEPVKKGRIVIATVKGDIHDIGKNIVRTVLENYGYDVLDLGRDVPPETVVDAVVKENIRLVGLSALMTTTLPSMEETVRQLHTLSNPPSIMVGGAVVTPEYAQNMGAFYAKDARASRKNCEKSIGVKENSPMRTLLMADIHGNFAALRAILSTPEAQSCGRVISLGDQVNFGPESRKVVETLRSLGATMLMGNHEERLLHPDDFAGYNWAMLRVTARQLSGISLADLPVDVRIGSALLTHGTPGDPYHLVYPPDLPEVLKALPEDVSLLISGIITSAGMSLPGIGGRSIRAAPG